MTAQSTLSDVFISYSRKDVEFARWLGERLKADGKEIWADWEDIPYSAKWWAEIQSGIESAHTFIFVISPDSAASKVCFDEISHAVKLNKRIIPLLYREVNLNNPAERARLHAAVRDRNWLFFTDENTRNDTYNNLLTTLGTDLGHLRLHTRLTMRAQEWEDKKRNGALLLRGSDLQEGEIWLKNSENLDPTPTELQKMYVTASRKAGNRNRQVVVSATMVTILLLGVAAVYSFIQAQNAGASLEQANILLTSVAYAQETAAAEAFRAGEEANRAATEAKAAQNSAATATIAQGGEKANADRAATEAARALDSAATATYAQGQAQVQARIAQQQAATATVAQGQAQENELTALAAAATATVAQGEAIIQQITATVAQGQAENEANRARRIALINAARAALAEGNRPLAIVQSMLALTIPGDSLAARAILNEALTNGGLHRSISTSQQLAVENMVVNNDHTQALTMSGYAPQGGFSGNLAHWDLTNGKLLHLMTIPSDRDRLPLYVLFSHDNQRALIDYSEQGGIVVVDLTTYNLTDSRDSAILPEDTASITAKRDHNQRLIQEQILAISNNGECKLLSGGVNVMEVVCNDPSQNRRLKTEFTYVTSIAFSPDDQRILIADYNGVVHLWDLTRASTPTQELAEAQTFEGHTFGAKSVYFSRDGQQAISVSGDGQIYIWDLEALGNPRLVGGTLQQGLYTERVIALSPDERYILTVDTQITSGSQSTRFSLWDTQKIDDAMTTEDERLIRVFEGSPNLGILRDAVVSHNGRYLLALDIEDAANADPELNAELGLWELSSGQMVWKTVFIIDRRDGELVTDVSISLDDRQALFTLNGITRRWDLDLASATFGQELTSLNLIPANRVAFVFNGTLMASANPRGVITIQDASGEIITTLRPLRDARVTHLALSTTGRLALASTNVGELYVWDIQTGEIILTIATDYFTITQIGFGEQDRFIYVIGPREIENKPGIVHRWLIPALTDQLTEVIVETCAEFDLPSLSQAELEQLRLKNGDACALLLTGTPEIAVAALSSEITPTPTPSVAITVTTEVAGSIDLTPDASEDLEGWFGGDGWSYGTSPELGLLDTAWSISDTTQPSALTRQMIDDLSIDDGQQFHFQSWLNSPRSQGSVGIVEIWTAATDWRPEFAVPASETWTDVTVDLSAYQGQTVQIRLVWYFVPSPEGEVNDYWMVNALRVELENDASKITFTPMPTVDLTITMTPTIGEVLPTESATQSLEGSSPTPFPTVITGTEVAESPTPPPLPSPTLAVTIAVPTSPPLPTLTETLPPFLPPPTDTPSP